LIWFFNELLEKNINSIHEQDGKSPIIILNQSSGKSINNLCDSKIVSKFGNFCFDYDTKSMEHSFGKLSIDCSEIFEPSVQIKQ
jgi:hypothetical protein